MTKSFLTSLAFTTAFTWSPAFAADPNGKTAVFAGIFLFTGLAGLWFAAFCDHTKTLYRSNVFGSVQRKLRLIEPYTDK